MDLGPRKLSVIRSVHIKRVSIKQGFTVVLKFIIKTLHLVTPAFIMRFNSSRKWPIPLFPLVFAIFVVD